MGNKQRDPKIKSVSNSDLTLLAESKLSSKENLFGSSSMRDTILSLLFRISLCSTTSFSFTSCSFYVSLFKNVVLNLLVMLMAEEGLQLSLSSFGSCSQGLNQSTEIATPIGTLYRSAFILTFSSASYFVSFDSLSCANSCRKTWADWIASDFAHLYISSVSRSLSFLTVRRLKLHSRMMGTSMLLITIKMPKKVDSFTELRLRTV